MDPNRPRVAFHFYALLEPDSDDVRYVGQTRRTLRERFFWHLADNKGSAKARWIQGLVAQDRAPRVLSLQRTKLYQDMVYKRKAAWMRMFCEDGHQLLNVPLPKEDVPTDSVRGYFSSKGANKWTPRGLK